MTRAGRPAMFDRALYSLLGGFLATSILGLAIWLAVLERSYHPRIHRYGPGVTIPQVGDSELDLNHPAEGFSLWCQTGSRNVRLWPR